MLVRVAVQRSGGYPGNTGCETETQPGWMERRDRQQQAKQYFSQFHFSLVDALWELRSEMITNESKLD